MCVTAFLRGNSHDLPAGTGTGQAEWLWWWGGSTAPGACLYRRARRHRMAASSSPARPIMSQPKIQPLQGGAYMQFARKKLSIWPGKHLTILDVQHYENGTISPASHRIYHIILLKLQWSTSRASRTSRSLTFKEGGSTTSSMVATQVRRAGADPPAPAAGELCTSLCVLSSLELRAHLVLLVWRGWRRHALPARRVHRDLDLGARLARVGRAHGGGPHELSVPLKPALLQAIS